MIYWAFRINWPFKEISQKDYFCEDWQLTKNKNLEIQLSRGGNSLVGIRFDFAPWGRDHAGATLELELFRHFFIINIYDRRHWDYENACWECN